MAGRNLPSRTAYGVHVVSKFEFEKLNRVQVLYLLT